MAQTSASSATRQPGKTLYTLFTIFSLLLKLPSWLIYYIPRRLRPHPQWTYKQAVMNKILRVVLQYRSAIHAKTPWILKPGIEKDRFVLIEPGHSRLYQGILNDPAVRPSSIGAVWHPSPPSAADIEKNTFVIHFHGGAVSLVAPSYHFSLMLKQNLTMTLVCGRHEPRCGMCFWREAHRFRHLLLRPHG